MLIGRFLAYLFFILMIMVLGAEGLRYLQGNEQGWITLSQLIEFVFDLETVAERSVNDGNGSQLMWNNILIPISRFSAAAIFFVVGSLLFIVFRKRN